MDEQQREITKAMISEALGGITAKAPDPTETPSQPALEPVHKNEPTYPSEVPLDEYEALMVDALGWRVDSIEKTNLLLNTEKNNVEEMKNKLLIRCVNRLKIDTSQYNIFIDSGTKRVKIQKRGE